ncbi:hypothetical protein ACFQH6_12645 [Halobacteriaceae archaeon GCM10025711]
MNGSCSGGPATTSTSGWSSRATGRTASCSRGRRDAHGRETPDAGLHRLRPGQGRWRRHLGADSYGIVAGTTVSEESEFRVVCTYHPEIPYEDYRGEESLDEPERDAFNDVLWEYGERVAAHAQESLDAFVERVDGRGG